MYYIYHIPGVKIGCTTDPERRVKWQGYTDWEILEEYTDGWLAGDREKELQAEYGYKVDKVHYMQSRQNWAEAAKAGGRKNVESGHILNLGKIQGRKNVETKQVSRAGKIGGRKNVESGQVSNLGKKYGKTQGKKNANEVHTCPHCGKTIKGLNYRRYHGDNCKLAPTT